MTQEELRDRIDAIQSTKVVNLGKYNSVEAWQEEKIIQLINRHVADIIGEDDKIKKYTAAGTPCDDCVRSYAYFEERNKLRAEQRKRGGL